MISHYLLKKEVSWNVLERIGNSKIDYQRTKKTGVVLDVDVTGTLACVKNETNELEIIDVCELCVTS